MFQRESYPFVSMSCQQCSTLPLLGILCCCCLCGVIAEDAQFTASGAEMLESSVSGCGDSSVSKAAVLSLFAKYGENGSLSFEAFERLLESLRLGTDSEVGQQSAGHDAGHHEPHDEHHHHHHHDRESDTSHDVDVFQHATPSANCTDSLSSRV